MQAEREAVYGIIFNSDRSEVLLVKRRDIPVWVLPGGGKDKEEGLEEGAVREVLEETGFHTSIVRKVATYLPVNLMTQKSHLFECKIVSGTASITSETLKIQFFPLNQLPPLPPPYEGWILDTVANHPETLCKEIEGVTYWVLLKLLCQHPLLVFRYLLTKMGIHYNST